MTEYSDIVEKQKAILAAEEMRNMVESLQVHSLNSMWYDNRPQDTENNKMVTDIMYMDERIERTLSDGTIILMQQGLKGEDFIRKVERYMEDQKNIS
tara:strand:+ start:82 stop:372 length:291 start_codon:yes stop_codon:yes gene_type:complete